MGNRELLEITMNLKDNFSKGVQRMKNKSVSGLARIKRGFQSMGAAIKKSVFNLKGLIAAFLALSALRGVIRFLKEATQAAIIQERAIVTLNAALMASGNFSVEASEGFKQYAIALQDSLGIADEVTLETLGMIEGLTALSTEALPRAMDAVIQISNLYKVDFKAASLLLGKSLTSNMNAFSRYGIAVDLAGTAQERLDEIIAGTAAGMVIAEEKMKTFEGQTIRNKNSWGDLKEAIGTWITQNPIVIAILTLTGTWINRLTGAINDNREGSIELVGKGFGAIIDGAIEIVKSIIGMVKTFTLARQGMQTLISALLQFALAFLESMDGILSGFLDWLFGVINAATSGINKFLDWLNNNFGFSILRIAAITISGADAMANAMNGIDAAIVALDENTDELTDKLLEMDATVETLTAAQIELAAVIAEAGTTSLNTANNFGNMTDAVDEMAEAIDGAGGALSDMNDQLENTATIFDRVIQFVIKLDTIFEALGRNLRETQRIELGISGPGIGAPRSRAVVARGQAIRETQEIFNALERSLIQSAENLTVSIATGDVAGAIRNTFDQVGSIIAQRVNDSIAKSFQTAKGRDTLTGQILGAAAGGFVGAGITLLGGLIGKKKRRGETAADAVKVEVVNTGNIADAILSALTKANIAGVSAAGINSITNELNGSLNRVGG